jgi:antirestriction protein ArdC
MKSKKTPAERLANWSTLLEDAINTPGKILKAYSNFHNYSMGNQLLALMQCASRGLEVGPINTFKGWTELGRTVIKGQKAIKLCMPVTVSRHNPNDPDDKFTMFVEKPRWFVMSQTEGADFTPPQTPTWKLANVLNELNIEQIKFDDLDGNVQGYARKRQFAINPLAQIPHKTTFHELGHIVLGHTKETDFDDGTNLARNEKEVEAESVSLICCEALGLDGSEYCRGYIQNWLQGGKIDEKTSQRIFAAANMILKAGRDAVQTPANVAT